MECDFDKAEPQFSYDMARRREADLRLTLYRAIYRLDIEAAEDAINMMQMVDIDRDLIWQARAEVRHCD